MFRSTTSGSGYTLIAGNLTTVRTSYVDTTVSAGATCYYVARARNAVGSSGNSPQFGAALAPSPMVNLAFGGTVNESAGNVAGSEGAAKAFDRNPGSKWLCSAVSWLQYDFGAGNPQVIKRYTVTSANDVPARDPKSWNVRGSQDGVSWTWLDSRSNETFANRFQVNTYDIGNTSAYRFYRLEITVNNGDASTQLSELGLFSDTGSTLPSGSYLISSRRSNKVVDLTAGGTGDGTDAIQRIFSGAASQKWTFTNPGNGQYQLQGLASGKLLEVTNASTSNGAIVQIWPSNGHNCQKWTVTPAGDDSWKLLNVNSGKAADVSSGSIADGAAIIQWPYSGADNQQWLISIAP